jgi:hypothetical protein
MSISPKRIRKLLRNGHIIYIYRTHDIWSNNFIGEVVEVSLVTYKRASSGVWWVKIIADKHFREFLFNRKTDKFKICFTNYQLGFRKYQQMGEN